MSSGAGPAATATWRAASPSSLPAAAVSAAASAAAWPCCSSALAKAANAAPCCTSAAECGPASGPTTTASSAGSAAAAAASGAAPSSESNPRCARKPSMACSSGSVCCASSASRCCAAAASPAPAAAPAAAASSACCSASTAAAYSSCQPANSDSYSKYRAQHLGTRRGVGWGGEAGQGRAGAGLGLWLRWQRLAAGRGTAAEVGGTAWPRVVWPPAPQLRRLGLHQRVAAALQPGKEAVQRAAQRGRHDLAQQGRPGGHAARAACRAAGGAGWRAGVVSGQGGLRVQLHALPQNRGSWHNRACRVLKPTNCQQTLHPRPAKREPAQPAGAQLTQRKLSAEHVGVAQRRRRGACRKAQPARRLSA